VIKVDQELAITAIEDTSTLTSAGLVWEPLPRMKVRLSSFKTLARPTFRELAPVVTEEFIAGDRFLGNPKLVLSKIDNRDVRWEWFRRPGEVLAVSWFEKEIHDPIELISFTQFGTRTTIQPVNYEEGRVKGYEIEARTGLDLIHPSLAGLAIGANYSKIDSEVDVPESEQQLLSGGQTEEGRDILNLDEEVRPLQGQPAYLFNANVTYDNASTGIAVGLFFNKIGETLFSGASIGEDGTPNVFEAEFETLDLTVSRRFGEHFSVGFKARNLLQPRRRTFYRTPDGEEATKQEQDTAVRLGLSASWKW
jgi:outer membrane receptor protein involved in Fe transport